MPNTDMLLIKMQILVFNVQKGLLEEIRLKRDVEILNIMYGSEIVKNLEISKFTLLNNENLY